METVKVWGFSACSAVVIGALASMLAPSVGKFKILRLTVSAFVLVGILSPFLTLLQNTDFSVDSFTQSSISTPQLTDQMQEKLTERLEDECASALFPILRQSLSEEGIHAQFGLLVELEEQSEMLTVDRVHIRLSDLHKIEAKELAQTLGQKTGLPIEIEVLEENVQDE